MGNQGGKALKWLPAHFKFERRNAPKSKRDRPSTLRDWPPCSPIQRDGGRRSRPGVNPFISALTVPRCPATFPGVWPQLRDTLSTSRSVGRGTGAFIYALSADENSPALAAPRHTSTALFSCRFKCPRPPRGQPHFRSNADRAYNTLHFASKVVCQRVPLWKPRTTKQAEYLALSRCLIFSLYCCQQPPFLGLPFLSLSIMFQYRNLLADSFCQIGTYL